MSKVAVLGGGLSGRLMAFQLAEQGISVELFEKGERNRCASRRLCCRGHAGAVC